MVSKKNIKKPLTRFLMHLLLFPEDGYGEIINAGSLAFIFTVFKKIKKDRFFYRL
jgi:hypothetical protein